MIAPSSPEPTEPVPDDDPRVTMLARRLCSEPASGREEARAVLGRLDALKAAHDRSGPPEEAKLDLGPLPHLPLLDGFAPNGSLVIFPALIDRLSEALGADLRTLNRDDLHDALDRLAALRAASDEVFSPGYPRRGEGGTCASCACPASRHHGTGARCAVCSWCAGWVRRG